MQKKEPLCTAAGNANGAATMGNSVAVLQKTENRTTIWSSNSILKTLTQKDIRFPCHCGIIYNSQDMDTMLSAHWWMNEWMKKCNTYT